MVAWVSWLTNLHLWKDSIGGSCKTTMIANVWGDAAHVDETAATLRFATRIGKIVNEAQANTAVHEGMGGMGGDTRLEVHRRTQSLSSRATMLVRESLILSSVCGPVSSSCLAYVPRRLHCVEKTARSQNSEPNSPCTTMQRIEQPRRTHGN